LDESDEAPEPVEEPVTARGDLPWNWIIGGALIILIALVGVAIVRSMQSREARGQDDNPSGAGNPTRPAPMQPAPEDSAAESALAVPDDEAPPTPESETPAPTATEPPATPTPEPLPTEPPVTPTLFVTSTLAPAIAAAADGPLSDPAPNNDVLRALDETGAEQEWEAGSFSAGDGGVWQLETGGPANSATITLDPPLLSELFGAGTANVLTSARVVVELAAYDEGELAAGDVRIGLGALNASQQSAIGTVQFESANSAALGIAQNGSFRPRAEAPLDSAEIELSVQRVNANTLGFYVNGELLGDSVVVFPEGQPITLVLTASGRGTVF